MREMGVKEEKKKQGSDTEQNVERRIRVTDEKRGKDMRREGKKGQRDERGDEERDEWRAEERKWERERIACFLTFKTHYLKLLTEAAYCLMC